MFASATVAGAYPALGAIEGTRKTCASGATLLARGPKNDEYTYLSGSELDDIASDLSKYETAIERGDRYGAASWREMVEIRLGHVNKFSQQIAGASS